MRRFGIAALGLLALVALPSSDGFSAPAPSRILQFYLWKSLPTPNQPSRPYIIRVPVGVRTLYVVGVGGGGGGASCSYGGHDGTQSSFGDDSPIVFYGAHGGQPRGQNYQNLDWRADVDRNPDLYSGGAGQAVGQGTPSSLRRFAGEFG